MLNIEIENQKSKYYICLDREEYTVYPHEKEVLLQAGLVAEIKSVSRTEDKFGEWVVFNLLISDRAIDLQSKVRLLILVIPSICLSI